MPKRRAGAKAEDQEKRGPYVALSHEEMDSMAFKTLSPNATWLLLQYRRAWTNEGRYERIELPFARVSWKLRFPAFDKARAELILAGFVRVVKAGGLLKNPTIYAMDDRWRGEVAKRLANDPKAGYTKNVRAKDGRLVSVWYPARRLSESQENLKKAAAAIARKKAGKKPALAGKPKKTYQTPKVYLNRVRVAKLLNSGGVLGKAISNRDRN